MEKAVQTKPVPKPRVCTCTYCFYYMCSYVCCLVVYYCLGSICVQVGMVLLLFSFRIMWRWQIKMHINTLQLVKSFVTLMNSSNCKVLSVLPIVYIVYVFLTLRFCVLLWGSLEKCTLQKGYNITVGITTFCFFPNVWYW